MKDLIINIIFIFLICSAIVYDNLIGNYIQIVVAIIFLFKNLRLKKLICEIRTKEIPKLLKRQKEDFIDTLNHDLKVPTIAQLRCIELIQNEIIGAVNDEQNNILTNVSDSCKYVLDMISMVQNSYKIDNNSYRLIYEKFNIADIIISCFDRLSEFSEQKNLRILYTPSDYDTTVVADKAEICKVIFNILYSAINYSKFGGRISVRTYSDKNRIIFSVSGMELEVNQNYSTIGHGIGMYLSKKIIELHNGKIYVPQDNNIANTYTFILPKDSKTLVRNLV